MTTVCELERVSAQPMKSQDYRQNQLCSLNKINPDQYRLWSFKVSDTTLD